MILNKLFYERHKLKNCARWCAGVLRRRNDTGALPSVCHANDDDDEQAT